MLQAGRKTQTWAPTQVFGPRKISSGMATAHTGYTATVMPIAVSTSRVSSTSSLDCSFRTGQKSVAAKDTAPHTKMPTLEMYRGNTSVSHPADTRFCYCAATTNARFVRVLSGARGEDDDHRAYVWGRKHQLPFFFGRRRNHAKRVRCGSRDFHQGPKATK